MLLVYLLWRSTSPFRVKDPTVFAILSIITVGVRMLKVSKFGPLTPPKGGSHSGEELPCRDCHAVIS
jgi:hypothetical protein